MTWLTARAAQLQQRVAAHTQCQQCTKTIEHALREAIEAAAQVVERQGIGEWLNADDPAVIVGGQHMRTQIAQAIRRELLGDHDVG